MPAIGDPAVDRLIRAQQHVDGLSLGLRGPLEHESEIH
jgi:hypothetical protein